MLYFAAAVRQFTLNALYSPAQGGMAATKTNNEDPGVETFEPYLAS